MNENPSIEMAKERSGIIRGLNRGHVSGYHGQIAGLDGSADEENRSIALGDEEGEERDERERQIKRVSSIKSTRFGSTLYNAQNDTEA